MNKIGMMLDWIPATCALAPLRLASKITAQQAAQCLSTVSKWQYCGLIVGSICALVKLHEIDLNCLIIEGSLEVKLPTIWTDEKQRWEESERKRRVGERRSEKRKSQKKEDADARKGRRVAKHCFFSNDLFVFDVVNFEKWGSLAELLRFWRCQVEISE